MVAPSGVLAIRMVWTCVYSKMNFVICIFEMQCGSFSIPKPNNLFIMSECHDAVVASGDNNKNADSRTKEMKTHIRIQVKSASSNGHKMI